MKKDSHILYPRLATGSKQLKVNDNANANGSLAYLVLLIYFLLNNIINTKS